MDYDRHQVRWYWLLLFVLYSAVVVYLLFNGNPYLYSHHELRESMDRGDSLNLLTVPEKSPAGEKVTPISAFQRLNFHRSAVDPLGTPRSKNYDEYQTFPVALGNDEFKPINIALDSSGIYLTGKSPWVICVGLDGEVRWKFRVFDLKDDKVLPTVLLDETTAYVVHPQGEALALNKADGSIRWLTNVDRELIAQPFLWQNHLILPVKGKTASEWMLVKRTDGKLLENSPSIDVKPGFIVTEGPGAKSILVTVENKIVAIDPEDWKVDWSATLTDPIKGPAVVAEQQIYVSTLGAKLIKLDAGKKGKVEWEADLEKPPESAPTYLPVAHRMAVMLEGGLLAMLDAKTGKPLWTYNTLNKSSLVDPWSVRISAKHIEEYKMDWLHKGWTIWSACSNRHFCIYTPNKGQLVQSVEVSATPLTLPLALDKRWAFFGEGKDGKYVISHLVEASEIKRLRAEAAGEKASGSNAQ